MQGGTVKILLVEDNPGDVRLVAEMLKDLGGRKVEMTHVETVAAALAHLAAHREDTHLILLDLSLPDESGLETVRRVLATRPMAGVVVMTGHGDESIGDEAVAVGAQDYLVKHQVDAAALKRALRFAIRRQVTQAQLQEESLTDALTGLNNRRGFLVHAEQYAKLARRNHEAMVLIYIDLDRFKEINDTHGHAEGDRALKATANVLLKSLREGDIKARIGGDEFVGLALTQAEHVDAAIRSRLEHALQDINARGELSFPLTFSVGLFRCPAGREISMEDLLKRADALMYEEKKRKREADRAVEAISANGRSD
jgi:diguanylate cyclase (GGDEF)-like protein